MKSESRRSGHSAPFRQHCTTAPEGVSPCGIQVTCLTTRPHWLLASLFRFQGATARHRTAGDREVAQRPAAPSRHSLSASTTPAGGGVRREASVSIHRQMCPGGVEILWRWARPSASGRRGFLVRADELVSPPMGSSGRRRPGRASPASTCRRWALRRRTGTRGTGRARRHGQLRRARQGLDVLDRRRGDRGLVGHLAVRLDLSGPASPVARPGAGPSSVGRAAGSGRRVLGGGRRVGVGRRPRRRGAPPPCAILRAPSLLDGTARERGEQVGQADPAVGQLADRRGRRPRGRRRARRGR